MICLTGGKTSHPFEPNNINGETRNNCSTFRSGLLYIAVAVSYVGNFG